MTRKLNTLYSLVCIFGRFQFALVILLCVYATHPAPAATSCIAAPSGLFGWPGDSDENYIVGGHNPSSVTNVSLVPGEVLNGFSFGTNGYTVVPSPPTLANQNFTWNSWVRPDGPGPNGSGSVILLNNVDGNTTNAVDLGWGGAANQFGFQFGNVSLPSEQIASKDSLAPDSFYLVAATYDGSVFRLFVNGVLEARWRNSTGAE